MDGADKQWRAMPTYASEMWMVVERNLNAGSGDHSFSPIAEHLTESNARRIAAALNVLAGVPTQMLEKVARRPRQAAGRVG